jgi:hypothetical protein
MAAACRPVARSEALQLQYCKAQAVGFPDRIVHADRADSPFD